MGGSNGYTVTVSRRETVAALLPLQEHWLPLSNLDLLLPPLDFGVFFCYRSTAKKPFADVVSGLKASLAKALLAYYALAGELVANFSGEPELLCNNRGVDFIEAYADVELRELPLHDPDESVERRLVPKKTEGVLCVQATELKCGGMVLACTFDHRIADAYSANMFLVAWAAAAAVGWKPLSVVPSFRRSLLCPRRPGCQTPSLDRLYVPLSSLPPPPDNPEAAEQAINRIYYITADDIDRIQAAAENGCCGAHQKRRRSKLEAFTAYLWRIIAKGAKQEGARQCSMGVVVDGRSRLRARGSMDNYFGNVLSIPYGTMEVAKLEGMAVGEVADEVHECLRGAATEEHFLGLVDWVEAHRPETAVVKVYCGGEGVGEVAVVVSSGRGFPVTEVEFGWGRPAFASYHFPWGGGAGYVMPMPSARGGGEWVVYVHLMRRLVEALEAEAGTSSAQSLPTILFSEVSLSLSLCVCVCVCVCACVLLITLIMMY